MPRTAQIVDDVDHPWMGKPRRFVAMAMPNGDGRFGVEGELVQVVESGGGAVDRLRLLSRAEAEQLRGELAAALRAFDVGEAITGRPCAVRWRYPFDHPTLAEVG